MLDRGPVGFAVVREFVEFKTRHGSDALDRVLTAAVHGRAPPQVPCRQERAPGLGASSTRALDLPSPQGGLEVAPAVGL